jgi:cysteinyl-tRNA synthetase
VVVSADGADHGAEYLALLETREREDARRAMMQAKALTQEQIAEIQGQRLLARQNRDFALADKLRDQLIDAGIEVGDRKVQDT